MMDEAGAYASNDSRGWIMCVLSGIACVFGASFICVDVLINFISGKKNFDIQRSTAFQAASYSLSFGVMIFSALYKMLPSSKSYLIKGGFSDEKAAWILLGCFSAGFIGIQVLLRLVHPYMPSHVVDCDHKHEESSNVGYPETHNHGHAAVAHKGEPSTLGITSESTPLLSSSTPLKQKRSGCFGLDGAGTPSAISRRTSMIEVPERVMSFVMDRKNKCDSGGPCFGYSDPCGQECYKGKRRPTTHFVSPFTTASRSATNRTASTEFSPALNGDPSTPAATSSSTASDREPPRRRLSIADVESQHHHHVPENAYMSTGLQTSVAIALHKLPEGFITYATNHASPSLGASVFFALFIHNLTEGFVLALPIYLALGSRTKAMLWASGLGGLSQPIGAGVAAAWFAIAGRDGGQPGPTGYGCLFGITSGIMTSVALHLFAEGLSLNHSKNMCVAFGFVGIVIMGIGNALTR